MDVIRKICLFDVTYYSGGWIYISQRIEFENCYFMIKINEYSVYDSNIKDTSNPFSAEVYKIPLASVNPSNIDHWNGKIEISATYNKNVFEHYLTHDKEVIKKKNLKSFYKELENQIVFGASPNEAKRDIVKRALIYLIKNCGGKSESF